jgi:hypothetical protein
VEGSGGGECVCVCECALDFCVCVRWISGLVGLVGSPEPGAFGPSHHGHGVLPSDLTCAAEGHERRGMAVTQPQPEEVDIFN